MSDNTQLTAKTQDLPSEKSAGEIVAQGHDRAKQLMDIVNQKNWSTNIQGKNYLQVEAWQTLGKFYGYTAKTKSTEYVEMGAIKGFNAVVEILNDKGQIVGGAEAGCYSDEEKWNTEPHQNRYGKQVSGSPLYSLKSMAQTRATGKAYRQILSWVAVLAGFQPTPAEEMTGVIIDDKPVEKTPAYGGEAQTQGKVNDDPATEAQINFMGRLRYKMTADEVQNYGFLKKQEAIAFIDELKRRPSTKVIVPNDLDQEVSNELARQEDDSRWEDTASRANQLDLNSYDGGEARQYQPS